MRNGKVLLSLGTSAFTITEYRPSFSLNFRNRHAASPQSAEAFELKQGQVLPFNQVLHQWTGPGPYQSLQLMVLNGEQENQFRVCFNINVVLTRSLVCNTWQVPHSWNYAHTLRYVGPYLLEVAGEMPTYGISATSPDLTRPTGYPARPLQTPPDGPTRDHASYRPATRLTFHGQQRTATRPVMKREPRPSWNIFEHVCLGARSGDDSDTAHVPWGRTKTSSLTRPVTSYTNVAIVSTNNHILQTLYILKNVDTRLSHPRNFTLESSNGLIVRPSLFCSLPAEWLSSWSRILRRPAAGQQQEPAPIRDPMRHADRWRKKTMKKYRPRLLSPRILGPADGTVLQPARPGPSPSRKRRDTRHHNPAVHPSASRHFVVKRQKIPVRHDSQHPRPAPDPPDFLSGRTRRCACPRPQRPDR